MFTHVSTLVKSCRLLSSPVKSWDVIPRPVKFAETCQVLARQVLARLVNQRHVISSLLGKACHAVTIPAVSRIMRAVFNFTRGPSFRYCDIPHSLIRRRD